MFAERQQAATLNAMAETRQKLDVDQVGLMKKILERYNTDFGALREYARGRRIQRCSGPDRRPTL